jgi:hypothetical protein
VFLTEGLRSTQGSQKWATVNSSGGDLIRVDRNDLKQRKCPMFTLFSKNNDFPCNVSIIVFLLNFVKKTDFQVVFVQWNDISRSCN